VLAHAMDCAICGRHLPGGVSVARVFGLLPDPLPGAETRDVVLARLTDPRHSGYRDFVARRAAQSAPIAALAAIGSPVSIAPSAGPASPAEAAAGSSDESAAPRRRARLAAGAGRSLSRGRLMAGVAAAGVAAMAGAILALAGFPGAHEITSSANGTGASSPAAVTPTGISSGPPSRIGAVGAAPIAPHGSGSATPPLLIATFPGKQRDGQALYLSASKQASAASSPGRRVLQRGTPPVTGLIVPPDSPAPSSSSGQPVPPSTSPTPSLSPSSSPSASPSFTHHRHRHGGGSSGSASPTSSDSPAPETSSPSTTSSARS
jgi:hypothetical protein